MPRCTAARADCPTTSPPTSSTGCASPARSSATSAGSGSGPAPTEPPDDPLYDPAELLGCASADVRIPFDIREVLARLLDGSRFEEFKPLFGDKLVCGWGSICGFPVGILGNNGILFSEEAKKGSQFIQLCNRTNTPLLFLHNITGFMVGSKAEQGGIIVNGAKMINAVSNSTVPHFNLMVGASYGAGNYGMAGKAYNPRLIFSWPNHRIAVMGPKQLAGVMEIVARNAAAGRGIEVDEEAITGADRRARGTDRARIDGALLDGADLGRRDHPPGRLPNGDGDRPRRGAQQRDRGRHRVRRVEALMAIATRLLDRQPWRDRGARSPAPPPGSASTPSACTRSPTPTRCTSTRSTSPSRSADRRRPSRTCAATRSSPPRCGPVPMPSIPGYGFLAENAEFAQAVIDAGLDVGRADARTDPSARRQGGRQEGRGRRGCADRRRSTRSSTGGCPTACRSRRS